MFPFRWKSSAAAFALFLMCSRMPAADTRTPTREGLSFGEADGEKLTMDYYAPNPDFSSYFAPELAVRSKRQITKGIGNEEAVEWKTVCVAPDQSVCSACFA